MTGFLYITIGAIVAGLLFTFWLAPFVYFLMLKASNFINDNSPDCHSVNDPGKKAATKFWVCDSDIGDHVLIGVVATAAAVVVWPLVVAGVIVMAILMFMRLASRLKRHMKDKESHS